MLIGPLIFFKSKLLYSKCITALQILHFLVLIESPHREKIIYVATFLGAGGVCLA